jgi:hypothetical protein
VRGREQLEAVDELLDVLVALEGFRVVAEARGPVAAARAAAAGAPAFLAAVLGDRPPEPSAARLWDGAAQLVLDYRSRWGITDPLSALGPDAHDGRQAKDRAQLDKALARARRLLQRRA